MHKWLAFPKPFTYAMYIIMFLYMSYVVYDNCSKFCETVLAIQIV